MSRTTQSRERNRAEILTLAEADPGWRRSLGHINHILDRWGLVDAESELRSIHLGRWVRPEARAAIRAARKACSDARDAVLREAGDRGML